MTDPFWTRFSADPRAHGQVRASDADRVVIGDAISEAFALGQIDADEFDERSEAAAHIKTLGEIPALVDDIVIAEADDSPMTNDSARARALARLSDDRIPITPEQIDAAAERYYKERRKHALIGLAAGPIGITMAIWAMTSLMSGQIIFFWPIFVIFPLIFGTITQITGKQEIIRKRKQKLMQRARAHLGDIEARQKLEAQGLDPDSPADDDPEPRPAEGPMLPPQHPFSAGFDPQSRELERRQRRERHERRRRRHDSWWDDDN